MERLTKRDTDGQAMMDCQKCEADWTGKHGKPMADCTALYCRNRLKDRLAAYEDSWCAPEEVLPKDKADEIALKLMRLADLESLCSYDRLRELAEADKNGRVVVPPCQSERLTMADYIRRETAVNAILGEPTDAHYPEWYAQILMKLPTADGAPVVHCRECEHSYEAVGGRVCTYGVCVDCEVTEDFFCSYGKRKEE